MGNNSIKARVRVKEEYSTQRVCVCAASTNSICAEGSAEMR